jgi:hypothetical protein
MRRFTAFLLILFSLAATSAAPLPDDLSKKFVGAWRLVSIEGNPPGRTNFYGHLQASLGAHQVAPRREKNLNRLQYNSLAHTSLSSKIVLDFSLSSDIINGIENSIWIAGDSAPAFLFSRVAF